MYVAIDNYVLHPDGGIAYVCHHGTRAEQSEDAMMLAERENERIRTPHPAVRLAACDMYEVSVTPLR